MINTNTMPQITSIILFFIVSLFSYLFSISNFLYFAPQLIAIISITILILYFSKKIFSVHLIALLINIIIFTTNGLNSPFFFLIYFLLFVIAFQNPPTTTLSYSLFLILIISQSLNSFISIISLSSLLLITPLAWFIGRQFLEKTKDEKIIAEDETDILLWHSLKLKTGLCEIIDTSSELLSQPIIPSQKEKIHHIKDSAKSLLNSSENLTQKIGQEQDET
jgi:signal transduction histidine kinase